MRRSRHPLARRLGAALVGAGLVLTGALTGAQSAAGVVATAAGDPRPRWGDTPGATADCNACEVFLYWTDWSGGVWTDDVVASEEPVHVGGALVDGPAATFAKGDLHVFGRGIDNGLWWSSRTYAAGTTPDRYSRWTSLGGVITSKPAAVYRGPSADDFSVFARGQDASLWQVDHDKNGWKAWKRVGGLMVEGTGPAAVHLDNGETWVLVVGYGNGLHALKLGGRFTPVGGLTDKTPALSAPKGDVPVAYVRGYGDDAAWSRELGDGTKGWHSLGGRFNSGLAATGNQPVSDFGAAYAFGLGWDDRFWWQHANYPDAARWEALPS